MIIKGLYLSFIICILTGFAVCSFGQKEEQKIQSSDSILKTRGEIYFSFSKNQLTPFLERIISIENIRNSTVYGYANQSAFQQFLQFNINFEIQPENITSSRLKSGVPYNVDAIYPSYGKYQAIMQQFKEKYSSNCELIQIGSSVQGRKLLMIKLTSQKNTLNRPAVLLASSIHGNELTGYKLLLSLIDYILSNYGKDDLVTKIMDETELWIDPLVNPDGTFFGGDNTVLQAKRFNANNLDLNRNFPDPNEGQHPDYNSWQPEVIALMNFYKQKHIVLSAFLHTGDELVNYPWDTWSRFHADNEWYKNVSREYVDLVHQKNSTYLVNFNNGIVNGYFWYRITGGHQDFVNYYQQGREVTIELSKDNMPDSLTLSNYWEYNRESLLRYVEQSLYGINGIITDTETGAPLQAKIELLNYDKDNSWVYSDSLNGVYHRLLAPGAYSLQISSPGYKSVNQNVILESNKREMIDVKLQPLDGAVIVYPNPFKLEVTVLFSERPASTQVKCTFLDVQGKILAVKYQNVDDKKMQIILPLVSAGFYILKLETQDFVKEVELMKVD